LLRGRLVSVIDSSRPLEPLAPLPHLRGVVRSRAAHQDIVELGARNCNTHEIRLLPADGRLVRPLQAEVIRLRQRNEVLSAIVRLLFMLLRLAGVRLDETRIPEGAAKAKILAAIARARTTLQLAVVLRVLGFLSFALPRLESSRSRLPTR
jgi:hypothetical protein